MVELQSDYNERKQKTRGYCSWVVTCVNKSNLCDKGVSLATRQKFFNAMVTSVACFTAETAQYTRDGGCSKLRIQYIKEILYMMKNPELCWNDYATSLTYVWDHGPQTRGQTMFNVFESLNKICLGQESLQRDNEVIWQCGIERLCRIQSQECHGTIFQAQVWLNKRLATNIASAQKLSPGFVEYSQFATYVVPSHGDPAGVELALSRFCALQKASGMKERKFRTIKTCLACANSGAISHQRLQFASVAWGSLLSRFVDRNDNSEFDTWSDIEFCTTRTNQTQIQSDDAIITAR